jgi:Flp pilus assembly protein protease CpaA
MDFIAFPPAIAVLAFFDSIPEYLSRYFFMTVWAIVCFLDFSRFPKFAQNYFLSADKDCREFVKDNYDPSPKLGVFKEPLYGQSKIFFFTFVLGMASLFFYNPLHHPFLEFLSLTTAFYSAQRLAIFDQKYMLLPDSDVIIFSLSNLALALMHNRSLQDNGLALLFLAGGLFIILGGFKFLGRDAMGMGDTKLLLGMTAFFGFFVFHLLFLACILGLVYYVFAKLTQTLFANPMGQFPFGPFLLISWCLCLFFL